jgi:hypothetical protein
MHGQKCITKTKIPKICEFGEVGNKKCRGRKFVEKVGIRI